ncbi:MAG TPA: hypothetical protein VNN10_12255 [Dehalococcoidia bacterium]|nr:hypothetical protein [Dehalococcoidia bacterium]
MVSVGCARRRVETQGGCRQAPVIDRGARRGDICLEALRDGYSSPPLLGQHTREVLTGLLGYDEGHLADLAERNVIAFADA